MLAGPAPRGLLIQHTGLAWCYGVDLAGLVIATLLFTRLGRYPVAVEQAAGSPGLAAVGDGLRYAVSRPDLLGTYLVDIVAMFMAMPTVLFPAFALGRLPGARRARLLYTAGTVGSFVATATSAGPPESTTTVGRSSSPRRSGERRRRRPGSAARSGSPSRGWRSRVGRT